MTRKKRRYYSKETKQKAKIRARVCSKVTGCSKVYAKKIGLARQVLLEELTTGIKLLRIGEDRVRGKEKVLITATLKTDENLQNQSPRNKYIIVTDAENGKKYRISYHQTIRILTTEEYQKLKKKIEMKEKEERIKKNETQSTKAKIRIREVIRDEKGKFTKGKYQGGDKPQNYPA